MLVTRQPHPCVEEVMMVEKKIFSWLCCQWNSCWWQKHVVNAVLHVELAGKCFKAKFREKFM